MQARLLRVFYPDAKLASVFAPQNAAKLHGEFSHYSEVRQFAFKHVNVSRLIALVSVPRGLMHSAAATIGEIDRPVAGSTDGALGAGGSGRATLCFGLRHFAQQPLKV